MSERNRFAMTAVGVTIFIGAALFAVTSMAASRGSDADVPAPHTSASDLNAKDRASAAALAKVPGGTIKESDTECEDGRLAYSFEVASPTGVVKVMVDALTGVAVVSADDDDDEKSTVAARSERKGSKADADDDDEEEDDDDDAKSGCSADHKDSAAVRW